MRRYTILTFYEVVNYSGIIKNDCENKWANNFEMVLYCIKNQSEAKRAIDNTIKDEISRFCENKWDNNFEMVEYCIKNQRDAKQKVISESNNIRRPIQVSEKYMETMAKRQKLLEIEIKALANNNYCAAWKACAEESSLLGLFQFLCNESEKEIIKEMLRETEVRSGTLYNRCVLAEGQRMEKELKTLEQEKKKLERSSTLKKNAIALQVSKRGFTDPTTGMEFIFVRGGCYQMGDNFGDIERDDKIRGRVHEEVSPVHEVCVSDFYLGKFEVTLGQFRKFVRETDYRTDGEQSNSCFVSDGSSWEKKSGASWKSPGFNQDDNNPVTCVSWNDATAFHEWLSRAGGKKYRLPTEAEWEYAARSGGKKERYAGTSSPAELKSYGWFDGNSENRTHSVGKKRPNGIGLYDMSGNVDEWCSKSPRNKSQEPESGSGCMLSGGSWYHSLISTCMAFRRYRGPTDCSNTNGFRLAIPAP